MSKVHQSLKSLAEDKTQEGIGKSLTTYTMDPRLIQIEDGFNARSIYPEHVAYLKQLQEDGVDTGYLTVQVVDGVPTLRDGQHRLTAIMHRIAEGQEVATVKVLEFKGDEVDATFHMLATQSGRQYTPLELGGKYSELVNKRGLPFSEIAKRRGMSVQHVKDCIRLTEQPVELKELIQSGAIKASTALKQVKKEGAKAALTTIKEGLIAGKGGPVTQKVIDNLAKNVVSDAQKRASAANEHVAAMLDSPAFDGPTKTALRSFADLLEGKTKRIALRQDPDAVVLDWLTKQFSSEHTDVQRSAALLLDLLKGKRLPDDNSPGAQFYGHMVWLQDMAAHNKDVCYRSAAHWFMAVLNARKTGGEIAPAPAIMSLEDAMRAEFDSGGAVRAETLCPEQTTLINYLRGRK